jgi:hypothetical protein
MPRDARRLCRTCLRLESRDAYLDRGALAGGVNEKRLAADPVAAGALANRDASRRTGIRPLDVRHRAIEVERCLLTKVLCALFFGNAIDEHGSRSIDQAADATDDDQTWSHWDETPDCTHEGFGGANVDRGLRPLGPRGTHGADDQVLT